MYSAEYSPYYFALPYGRYRYLTNVETSTIVSHDGTGFTYKSGLLRAARAVHAGSTSTTEGSHRVVIYVNYSLRGDRTSLKEKGVQPLSVAMATFGT